ncbi:MAG: CBS domain-containing protein [Kofleriaceae bacterium]
MTGAATTYRLSQIASRDLMTVFREARLRDAAHTMVERHISALVVVDANNEPVGLITMSAINRHLCRPMLRGKPSPTLERPVFEAMTPILLTLHEDCPVVVAARIMSSSRIHRVLVTQGGRCTGLVSLTDIARLVAEVGLHGDVPDSAELESVIDIRSPRELFVASMDRCLEHAGFVEAFCTRFLATSSDIRAKFAGGDIAKQHAALTSGFRYATDVALGKPGALGHLTEEAALHDHHHRDIRPEMYALWLESLIATVRETDARCDLVTEHAWRIMMGNVISYMTRRY